MPVVEHPAPVVLWLFVALCCLFVNSAATIAIYAAYVFAFELEPNEYAAWLRRGLGVIRAIARGTDLPARAK